MSSIDRFPQLRLNLELGNENEKSRGKFSYTNEMVGRSEDSGKHSGLAESKFVAIVRKKEEQHFGS